MQQCIVFFKIFCWTVFGKILTELFGEFTAIFLENFVRNGTTHNPSHSLLDFIIVMMISLFVNARCCVYVFIFLAAVYFCLRLSDFTTLQ